jgi:hypothetical protein
MSMRSTPPAPGCVRFRTELTHALARSPRAGDNRWQRATPSMRSTSPTTRRRSGQSGIGTSPSEASHRGSSSPETSGATAWARSTSPISARRTGSHVWGWSRRNPGAEGGPPTRRWARSSGGRGGRDSWRRAQRGLMVWFSAFSLPRPRCRPSRSGGPARSPSRRPRRPGCVREAASGTLCGEPGNALFSQGATSRWGVDGAGPSGNPVEGKGTTYRRFDRSPC